jgi:hypothetical protein
MRVNAPANMAISRPPPVGSAIGSLRANPATARVIWTSGLVNEREMITAKAIAPMTTASPPSRAVSRTDVAVDISWA